MVRPLDESQGSSPVQGHISWLVCEVALSHRQTLELFGNDMIWTYEVHREWELSVWIRPFGMQTIAVSTAYWAYERDMLDLDNEMLWPHLL